MMKKMRKALPDEQAERPTRPSPPPLDLMAQAGARAPQSGKRNLREAVIRLTRKVEALGVDVSEVTELLGIENE
jgi:hypothetical protein